MDLTNHSLDEFAEREDGFDSAVCACGWETPPCPGHEEAANFWGQHLLAVFLDEAMI